MAAILAWQRWWAFLVATAIATVTAAGALRMPFTRVVANDDGVTVHLLTASNFYPWEEIAMFQVAIGDMEHGALPVYTPQMLLANGGIVDLTPTGCYRRAMAAAIGAHLNAQRRSNCYRVRE